MHARIAKVEYSHAHLHILVRWTQLHGVLHREYPDDSQGHRGLANALFTTRVRQIEQKPQ